MYSLLALIAIVVITNMFCAWLDEFIDAMDEVGSVK